MTSAYSPNTSVPALASSPAKNTTLGHVAPATLDKGAPFTVVTDQSTEDVQVIQGTKYIGEIAVNSETIGVAYDSKNKLFYVGGESCDCVIVIDPSTLKVVTTISIGEPGAA
jgi:YVTN family beta-propeller protein